MKDCLRNLSEGLPRREKEIYEKDYPSKRRESNLRNRLALRYREKGIHEKDCLEREKGIQRDYLRGKGIQREITFELTVSREIRGNDDN